MCNFYPAAFIWGIEMILTRRKILTGLIAAPAIIAYDRLMPVKLYEPLVSEVGQGWGVGDEALTVLRATFHFTYNKTTAGLKIIPVLARLEPSDDVLENMTDI